MKDEMIADLVLTAAEDMASAALDSAEALEFLTQIAGWNEASIEQWMKDNKVCFGCLDNFKDNHSLHSPNGCVCEEEVS